MSSSNAQVLRVLLGASTAAGMLCAAPAFASEPEAVATADPVQETQATSTLETVDVDGRRVRREPASPRFTSDVVDTPRAVTVIPKQIIEQTGATSLQDLLRTSPGITFGAGEGGQPLADRPFIRGQASANNVFLDGIRDTGGQQREVFALEQVEVIKGPDSVYSGRGSGGGAINLSTKSPRLERFTTVSLGGGTDGYLRGTVDWNAPLSDTAALRINLMAAEGDVPGRDAVDYDKWGVLVSTGIGLGTDTSLTASYYHLTSNQMPDYGIPLFTKIGVRTTDSGILDVPYDSFYGLTARDYLVGETDAFTLDFRKRLSDAITIRNVSRYSESLNDYVVTNPGDGGNTTSAPPGVALVNGVYWMKRGLKSRWNPTKTLSNVTDIFGTADWGGVTHSYDLGLELSRERNNNASWTVTTLSGSACPAPLTGFDCTPLYDPNPSDPWTGTIVKGVVSTNLAETTGLYAFDSIAIGERWIVNLGVRYDDYSVEGTDVTGTVAAPVATSRNGQWDFVNYQLGVVYKPSRNASIYASWSTSSTPPTIAAGDQNAGNGQGTGNLVNVLLEPEDTTSYEIGGKLSLFRQQLLLSAAAFRLTRENAQVQISTGVYAQVGEVEVQGVELGVSGNVTPRWQVFGGYTYMDSELVRGAFNGINTGDPLANTPEHAFSLFSTYTITDRFSAGGGVYYVSKSFGGNQGGAGGGANRIYAPEYTRVDLFASYDLNDRASLQLNVQNAGDEAYIIRTNGVHHADVAPARSATLALNLRF
ncbi:TonB-dependent siderophore receptor [Brevundimonas sp. NIBR11]|uniref:TonB-dependent receptor n=1 Tax=Brevundimonas sp. NIBR11 TaxID=3015999 RepID=UPI0022F03472|nr:TonB-dependent siderophore receptor [Brevundimonas sp. NIBR11]WGM30082.1 putative TonB-dependent receptor BfrD [Brevundimonas sp. NIBR11]